MLEKSNNEIIQIIQKYIQIIKEILERERLQEEMSNKSYITNTEIVPHDFFSDINGKLSRCDAGNKVLFKEFGKPIILFNDLKNSTKLIEELECKNELCIYAIYMYYSSKMMGEILNILNGKMVECTGDGHYSVFLEDEINDRYIMDESVDFFCDLIRSSDLVEIQNYILTFDADEVKYLHGSRRFQGLYYSMRSSHEFKIFIKNLYSNGISDNIRTLFFYIFAIFNIEVNSILKHRVNNKFLTRIGCKQGLCKITRVNINGHIKQDKLIGAVVHHAAHQASGK